MESNNDASSRRHQRPSFSSKVKGKLRSLSRSRQKTRSPAAESDSETDTLVNFVIDSSNQDAYILEEQESPEGSDVHRSPSHPLSEHASSVTPVRPQDSTDDLDQDNTAWSSRKPRKQTKKKPIHGRDVTSKPISEPTSSNGQATDRSSTSSAEQYRSIDQD